MGIIEYHQGCPIGGKASGCWGPVGNYYTIFGTELQFLTGHMIASIILGAFLFCILFFLKKKKKLRLPLWIIIAISLIGIILIFFILAFFFPVRVLY